MRKEFTKKEKNEIYTAALERIKRDACIGLCNALRFCNASIPWSVLDPGSVNFDEITKHNPRPFPHDELFWFDFSPNPNSDIYKESKNKRIAILNQAIKETE